jgi:hypothetical protein
VVAPSWKAGIVAHTETVLRIRSVWEAVEERLARELVSLRLHLALVSHKINTTPQYYTIHVANGPS